MTDNQLDRSQDSHTYLYDTAQRFTKMERGTIGGTPTFYQGYTLDALANWSSFNNNGTTESRSHDVMNAIITRGATSLSHDLNGNLTNDGNQKYIWDELNRLVEVRDSGNNIICDYYYNANNLRVEKHHAGGVKEQFYYDGATVLVETDGSQTKVREYVNGGQYIDEVILVVNGSNYNYYMSDLRYCVTGFIDSTGAVVERARYDGYGKLTLLDASYATIAIANVDQSYGYTGIRHDDESGLQYYRARYFDNTLGRFINHDPLGYVDGLNLYRGYFVPNGLDPSGLKDEECCKEQLKKVEEKTAAFDLVDAELNKKIAAITEARLNHENAVNNVTIAKQQLAQIANTINGLDSQINQILARMQSLTGGTPTSQEITDLLKIATSDNAVASFVNTVEGVSNAYMNAEELASNMTDLTTQLRNASTSRTAALTLGAVALKNLEKFEKTEKGLKEVFDKKMEEAQVYLNDVWKKALSEKSFARFKYIECLMEE